MRMDNGDISVKFYLDIINILSFLAHFIDIKHFDSREKIPGI